MLRIYLDKRGVQAAQNRQRHPSLPFNPGNPYDTPLIESEAQSEAEVDCDNVSQPDPTDENTEGSHSKVASTGQVSSIQTASAAHMPPPEIPITHRTKRSSTMLSQSQIRQEEKQREQIAFLERQLQNQARIKELERLLAAQK
jgi:hypothetical protein